jgi:hypothetical protein
LLATRKIHYSDPATWKGERIMLGLLTTVGVIAGLTGLSPAADVDLAGNKKLHAAHGLITDVATDGTSFTLQIHPHKKKNAPAPATAPALVEKKLKIDKDTKVEFVSGKKGERVFTPAGVSDIHKGEHVIVVFRAGQTEVVDKVTIVKHKKKV